MGAIEGTDQYPVSSAGDFLAAVSNLQFPTAVCHPAELSQGPFPTEGSFPAAPRENSAVRAFVGGDKAGCGRLEKRSFVARVQQLRPADKFFNRDTRANKPAMSSNPIPDGSGTL